MHPLLLVASSKQTTNNNTGSGYNPTGTDPYFKYVTALLHGQGSNGAVNNVFVDSSANNFAITRNGSMTQGTFTPYGNDFSYSFNGSTDYFTYAPGSGNVFGTADFTVECWVNPAAALNSQYIIDNRNATLGAAGSWCLYFSGSSGSQLGWFNGTSSLYDPSTTDVPVGQWTHVAYCRASGTGRLFVNGVVVASGADTTNYSASSTLAYIGTRFNQQTTPNTFWTGYFSQLRVTKSARYTANFTPATTSFTPDANTTLATAKANRFNDSGINGYVITPVGTPKVVKYNPFGDEGTSYSTTAYGGSAYFDGSGSNLQAPQTGAGTITLTGDFTLECWYYPLSTGSCYVFSQWYGNTATLCSYIVSITGSYLNLGYGIGGANGNLTGTSAKVIPYQWNHLAVTRTSNTIRLFVNGVQDASTWTLSGTFNTGPIGPTIGATTSTTGGYANGHICDARIVNGTSLYSSNFTPSGPLTNVTNTAFLLKMQNAGVFDSSMTSNAMLTANAKISTNQAKFGTSSMYFDGTSNTEVQLPETPSLNFGLNNFTIECWIFPTANAASASLFGKRNASTEFAQIEMQWVAGGYLTMYATTASGSWPIQAQSSTTIPMNTWSHIAVVRNGSSFVFYLNGNSVATGTLSGALFYNGAPFIVGGSSQSYTGGGSPWTGYIQDFRITNGIARYTSSFSVPTLPFPDK